MKIIFATRNEHKVEELRRLLEGSPFSVYSLNDIGYEEEIIEDGETFTENALIKAKQVYRDLGIPTLADDSGICVDSLNGEPGIYSARYGGQHLDSKDKNLLLLKELEGKENRNAHYTCALCFIKDEVESLMVEEYCYGEIVFEERGLEGFGFDPIFYLPSLGKTMAEISLEEKNILSHRGKALRTLLKQLKNLYGNFY